MVFFSKGETPDLLPLVEVPKAGEPIVFDEEEQQAIDKEIQRQFETLFKDKVFPKEVTETLSQGFAVDALRNVVQRRIYQNDLKGAASTCMKLLGIALEIMPNDWLILAKILALYGDSIRAKNFIAAANKTHKKFGFDKMTNEGWKIQVQKVQDIIDSIKS